MKAPLRLIALTVLALPWWPGNCLAISAGEVFRESGVRGGLIVHVGCGDGSLTAALRAGNGYLVHGLDTNPAHVDRARAHVRSLGLYGPVSIDTFDGRRLPYVDNLVNLVVAEDLGEVPMAEVLRVLCPRGVAYVKRDGRWTKTVKPWPQEIDEWTHFLHGPDNNAVADDVAVGPPRRMQWLAGPQWTRHHHKDKGTQGAVRAMVSAGGRLFYMVDEATAANINVPSRWFLVARDAFSGVVLWKKPVAAGLFPRRLEQLWRQIIAQRDRVFVQMGTDQPLCALDAATGEVVKSYPGTENLEEVIEAGDRLFAVVDPRCIVALHADSAEELWRWAPPEGVAIVPLTLAASGNKVFVKTDASVCCLSAETGRPIWRFVPQIPGKRRRLSWPRAKLIATDDVVLCSYGGINPEVLNRDKWEYLGSHPRVNEYGGTLAAFSADDGRVLWQTAYKPGLESYPGDIFVIDGRVWLGPDYSEVRDLHTGKVTRTDSVLDRLWTTGHHHRCYPEKATSRYILTGKRGVEMIDVAGEEHSRNNWVRGTCRIGVTPCNGLMYATPHSCGCYMEAKLYGFWALASEKETRHATAAIERLEKGPAFGQIMNHKSQIINPPAWPTYRHDPVRSGGTAAEVPAELKPVWKTRIGGRVTAPVVAAGRVVMAEVDGHRIVCLDANTGQEQWSFATGGRVDSPPTVYEGLVLAGCADGWVYCLRLVDGKLAWRFLAAPLRINAVAFDQVESLWPVHGSVLVKDGVAYATAGRSSYLDGGITLCALDPATGKLLHHTRLRSEHPGAMDPPPEARRTAMEQTIAQNNTDYKTFLSPDRSDAFSMAGARSDVLVADADSIYLRHLRFDGRLVERETRSPHLLSVSSLLDGAEIHRSHWILGTGDFSRTPVAYSWIAYGPNKGRGKSLSVPYGLMMTFDDRTVWGVRRNHLMRWKKEYPDNYILFAQERPDRHDAAAPLPDFRSEGVQLKWTAPLPLRPRAMLRAADRLFVGGMPDSIDPSDPWAAANAAFEGRREGLLLAISCRDGKILEHMQLDSPPVWDGMAVAAGRLYLVDRKGRVLCMAGEPHRPEQVGRNKRSAVPAFGAERYVGRNKRSAVPASCVKGLHETACRNCAALVPAYFAPRE